MFQPTYVGEIIENGWYVLGLNDDEIIAGPLAESWDAYEVAEAQECAGVPTDVAFILAADIRAAQAADDAADAYFDRVRHP